MPSSKAELIFNRLEELGIIVGDHLFSSEGFKIAQSEGAVKCDNCSKEFLTEERAFYHQEQVCGSGTITRLIPPKLSEVYSADFDTILDPNYIYIFWNGLNVGKFGQSSVYVYSPRQELNIEADWDSGNFPENQHYTITFDMSSNCPDGVKGICWRSQNGGSYESWGEYEVSQGGYNLFQFFEFNKTVVYGNESRGYQAYRIPIYPNSSTLIRALNYAKRGIGL